MCKLYVFISSDSIYDVCDPKIRREDFIKETHSIRPENEKMIEELNDDEEYGNDKLKCEEYLISHVNLEEFPYVCLRLPDVIGPFDRSGRFWAYMKWIAENQKSPVHINKYSNLRLLSLVYSQDVINLLMQLLERIRTKDEVIGRISGQSFNICFDQHTTLLNLINLIAQNMKVENLKFLDENELVRPGKFFYPSVECGPISNQKAKEMLGFQSSSLDEAVKTTVQFFKSHEEFYPENKKATEKFHEAISIKHI